MAGGDCARIASQVGLPALAGAVPVYCRAGYAVAHDPVHRVPYWVAQRLVATTPTITTHPSRRDLREPFQADPQLPAQTRAELADYKGTGFDRGHMAPVADMADALAMQDSYRLSNVAPQVGVGLNRGIWARLEAMVREWACDRSTLIVFTGPLFLPAMPSRWLNQRVGIPDGFFKILYDPKQGQALAFQFANQPVALNGNSAYATLAQHVTSIDAIEAASGLDFMPTLPPDRQQVLEADRAAIWPQPIKKKGRDPCRIAAL